MNSSIQVSILKYLITILLILNFSCSENEQVEKVPDKNSQFTVLKMEETGLNFNNKLEESTTMNGFYYEYFYNGGGVAVADYNNDGLQDVYFISNLRTNKLYLNQGDLKFKNISVKANVQGKGGFPTGVTVVDINNDGLKDIYILKSGRFQEDDQLRNELLINQGMDDDGIPIFEEKAALYGLDLPHYSTQASFFDYDRDGDLDMFLINHNIEIYEIDEVAEVQKDKSMKIGEKLYRNDNGQYVHITEEAGIISNNIGFGLGVAIGDVNNDGWPDIYTSNDYYEKDHLYLNNQDGTFTESSLQSFNHMSTFSMGSDIADMNNDGLLDIISLDMMAEDNYTQKTSMSGMNVADFYMIEDLGLHRQYMYNALQMNNGTYPNTNVPAFSDIAQLAGISSTDWSWAPLMFDMDNDGYRDLFVSNGIKRDFRNNDFLIYLEKKYQEGVRKKKLDLAKHVDDLLDRLPERGKENYIYLNKGNLQFNKLEIDQPHTYSNGAAYADFDNDGDLDIVTNNTDDFVHLYRNNQNVNNYLKIKLKGSKDNIDGIGARVEVVTKENTLTAENYFTRGFQSAMAGPVQFGIGENKQVDTLKVIWPDGKSQILTNLSANQEITVRYAPKGSENFEQIEKNFKFRDITDTYNIDFSHKENDYNDFERESLLPHKMSQFGPCLSVADVNNDGLEDFYVGGAMGQAGALFLQTDTEGFAKISVHAFDRDKHHEDTGSLFLDADNDGDQDLYVVSGGNEKEMENEYYQDRFYTNDGQGNYTKVSLAIPDILTSGQALTVLDFDKDGDLDLFVGSRVQPRNYGYSGESYLLENISNGKRVKFEDVTKSLLPELQGFGMVTDALWSDIDGDGNEELILSQEWGNIQAFSMQNGHFVNVSKKFGLNDNVGWWYSLAADDIDNDGDMDLIAGNLGLNYKYKASREAPFHLYLNDFDNNDTNDIVLGYQQDSTLYPLRGRECTSNQMPFVKKKFKTYEEFGKASLEEVFGDALDSSTHKAATNFASCILENTGDGRFEFRPLPNEVQISSINEILTLDLNKDSGRDLLLLGNLYGSEVETPRNDASYGHLLKGIGEGNFEVIFPAKSGLFIRGDVRGASFISLGKNDRKAVLVARNNDTLMLLSI